MARLEWHGQAIIDQIRAASADAVNTTLAQAVSLTKQPGWTPHDTGALQNSITFEEARPDGKGVVGSFGSYDVYYAIYQEIGTRFITGSFYLRRAADQAFPGLPGHMAGIF